MNSRDPKSYDSPARASRKTLNRWARKAGYSDFDTYIRSGGSILDAAKDIALRIRSLQDALKVLLMDLRHPDEHEPDTLAQGEPVHDDEPPDPHNAQIQGDDAA